MGLFRSHRATILPLVRFMETPINPPLDNTFYKVTHRSLPNFCLSRKKVVPLRDKTGLRLRLGLRTPPTPSERGTAENGKTVCSKPLRGDSQNSDSNSDSDSPDSDSPDPLREGDCREESTEPCGSLIAGKNTKAPKDSPCPDSQCPDSPCPLKEGELC